MPFSSVFHSYSVKKHSKLIFQEVSLTKAALISLVKTAAKKSTLILYRACRKYRRFQLDVGLVLCGRLVILLFLDY